MKKKFYGRKNHWNYPYDNKKVEITIKPKKKLRINSTPKNMRG